MRSEPVGFDPHAVLAERHVDELKLAAIVGRREPLEIRGGVVKNDPRLGNSRMRRIPNSAVDSTDLDLRRVGRAYCQHE